jgi:hypothetical protein
MENQLNQKLQELEAIMGAECETKTLHSREVLEFIEGQPEEERPVFFRFVIKNHPELLESNRRIKGEKGDDIWRQWCGKMKKEAENWFSEVRKQNGEPEEVANLLQKKLGEIEKENGKEAKIIFFAYVLLGRNTVLPYFKLTYPIIRPADFEELEKELEKKSKRIAIIIKCGRFRTRAELAAALTQILDEEEDKRKKAFLLLFTSSLLSVFEKKSGPRIIGIELPVLEDFLSFLSGLKSEHTEEDCEKCSDLSTCLDPRAEKVRKKLGKKPN